MANLFRCGGGRSEASYQNLMDQLIEETATGPIASFTDGANNIPTKEVICHINPTETGTGEKSPQNPYVIGGHTGINVYQRATNLWDEQWEEGAYNSNNGNKINYNNRIRSKNFIPVAPNSQYFVSKANWGVISIYRYDKNKNYLGTTNVINSVFTTSSDCYFVNFNTGANSGSTYTNDISINYPSTVRGYYAYIGDTVNVLFGQTVYGGEFVATEGEYDKLTGDTNIITFDGSNDENWLGYSLGDGWQITISDMKSGSHYNNPKAVCNVFNKVNNATTLGARIGNNNQVFYLVQVNPEYSISSLAELKTWLSNNPVTITYPVDTPSEITLPTKTQVNTLLGANNFYHDCNGDIDVTYRANGALYVQEHPITRGLMAARPTEQIQEQEEQQEEKEINKSEDNEK